MIKQIRRGVALTILTGMAVGNVLAIFSGSDKATIQNSTLNEQAVEQETNVILPSIESNHINITRLPYFSSSLLEENSMLDSSIKEEESEVEKETTTESTTEQIDTPIVETSMEEDNSLFAQLTDEEWDILYRVARCEAGDWCKTYTECGNCSRCEDAKEGQKNIVYVILNRLNNPCFPKTVKDIVFAKSQFSVVNSDKFYNVVISDYCKANVQEAVKDYQIGISAQGALYFNSISPDYWSYAEYLFTDAVGHYFFK